MTTIRVLLADDHPVVRRGLHALLADRADILVVGEATSGDEAQELSLDLHPDVLLLDLSMPGPSAADTVRFLQVHRLPIRVVVLTAHRDEAAVRELVSLGIGGYVLKDDEPEAVHGAISTVASGGTWFSPLIMQALVRTQRSATRTVPCPDLTGRERELLGLIRRGWENKRIARELNLGEQTVRNYLTTVYAKIGVTSRAEAVVWTHEHEFDDR